jgi:hypothetical protein
MDNHLLFSMGLFKKSPLHADRPLNADKMARISLILGCMALIFIITVEYTIFLVIPSGILAIVTGNLALNNGTRLATTAGIGKGLGIAVLVGFAFEGLLAIILIAFWNNWIEL